MTILSKGCEEKAMGNLVIERADPGIGFRRRARSDKEEEVSVSAYLLQQRNENKTELTICSVEGNSES